MKEKNNIVYSCREHGEGLYHQIKNSPDVPKDYIYCVFPVSKDKVKEKMWVQILKGDRQKGIGNVCNIPEHADFELNERVAFKTDENDITHAKRIAN